MAPFSEGGDEAGDKDEAGEEREAGELLRGERKYGLFMRRGFSLDKSGGGKDMLAYLDRRWGVWGAIINTILCSGQSHSLKFERGYRQACLSLARFAADEDLRE